MLKRLFRRRKINGYKYNEPRRNKWVIEKLSSIKDGKSVLDVGAGEQPFKKDCMHLEYFSQDYAQYDGEGNGESLQTKKWDYGSLDFIGDICEMDFSNKKFDVILCTEVLEHLPDPVRALEKMKSLLVDGGELIITVPFASLTHFAPYHYCSGFNKYFFSTHLKSFDFLDLTHNGNYYEFLLQELTRLPDVAAKFGDKKMSPKDLTSIEKVKSILLKLPAENSDLEKLLCFGIFVHAKKL